MKNTFTFFLLLIAVVSTPVLAQKGAKKIYVARVNNSDTTITGRDRNEITFQAKNTIKNLEELLGLIVTVTSEAELDKAIKDSYLPNENQIFYNDGVVVEDDIDPTHTSSKNTADLPVDRYLKNLLIFYSKSDTSTIKFSRIITSSLIEGKAYLYVKVFFTSTFNGKYNDQTNNQINVAYQPVQRVAELRTEKVNGKWRTLIVRLGFPQPDESLTNETKPVISNNSIPKQPIKGKLYSYRSTDNASDSITARWDKSWLNVVRSTTDKVPVGFYQYRKIDNTSQAYVSITLTNKDRLLAFRQANGSKLAFGQVVSSNRLLAWIQIIAGTAALGASYVGYSSLQSSHNAYSDRLTALNSEYAIWQTLTQQPGGSSAPPMTFNSYAQPGIYAVYGGGLVGSGLIINGIRQLIRAGKIKALSK
ncbi:hypothetical protein ACFSUS_05965 [Spirosoma soli]|uniref:Uncharacterized protein n=1 Tax=Spirosoma soli TaxID=1770529 RepID=A0ABW5M272_9BACT